MQDDVEHSGGGGLLFTPALTNRVLACCSNGELSGLQLDHRAGSIAAVENEIGCVLPANTGYFLHDTSIVEAKAERSMRPEAIALAVFGGIAALATLGIAGQGIGRQLRADDQDPNAFRA